MRFISYGSSSAGSNYLLNYKDQSLIFDIGLNDFVKPNHKNADLWQQALYLFISHEHIDHVRYLDKFLLRYPKAKVIINKKSFDNLKPYGTHFKFEKRPNQFIILNHDQIYENPEHQIKIAAIKIQHNSAANNGYVIKWQGKKIVFFTDCGRFDYARYKAKLFDNTDLFLIESNYLENVSYFTYKERLQYSEFGHFSNLQCRQFIDYVKDNNKNAKYFLLHTSSSNYKNADIHDVIYADVDFMRLPLSEYYENQI